jgi:hypothetical protein
MRVDYQAVYEQLRDALDLLKELRGQGAIAEYTAQLLRVGQVLLSPPVASVTEEAKSRLFQSKGNIQDAIGNAFVGDARKLLSTLQDNLSVLTVDEPHTNDLHWARKTVSELMSSLAQSGLTEKEPPIIVNLRETVSRILARRRTADDQAHGLALLELDLESKKLADQLEAQANAARMRMTEWAAARTQFDLHDSIAAFERFYTEAMEVLSGGATPGSPPNYTASLGFFWPARILAGEVLRALSSRPQVHQSVMRLRIWLELYEREELIEQMEAAKGKSQQNERVLQLATDRFLFGEGLFPLTHVSAAGGSIDTLLEQKYSQGLSESLAIGAPPALIELKQVVRLSDESPPNQNDVKKAINEGLKQAGIYRSHLDARWASHNIYAVVAYNGAVRYQLETPNDRVVLVYLGEEPPSGKKTLLEL